MSDTINAYREAGTMIDKVVILPEGEVPAGWGDDAGLVMEAEDSTVGSNWQLKRDLPLADALWSDPDINAANIEIPGAETDSPRVDYVFEAGKTGTHYVWLRGSANPVDVGDSNSGHVGLDGSIPDSGDEIAFPGATVTWFSDSRDGPRATVSVSGTGRQTLGVWMREDGMRIDRVLLTTSSGYDPNNVNSGRGPALSAAAASPLTLDDLEHDAAGNLTFDGKQEYAYDAWNRMVAVTQSYRTSGGTIDSGPVISVIAYDALGRRTVKAVQNSADLDCTYHFYYDGQSLVEERDGSDNVLRQNVWGLTYIDELALTSLNDDPDDLTEQDVESHYYAAHDAQYNVLGLLEAAGSGNPAVLVERYEYTPYGERQVFKPFDSADVLATRPNRLSQRFTVSSVAQPYGLNPIGHQGKMHDEESGLIYNNARYRNRWGFITRDPIGYPDGMNAYAAYHVMRGGVDPSGFLTLDWPWARPWENWVPAWPSLELPHFDWPNSPPDSPDPPDGQTWDYWISQYRDPLMGAAKDVFAANLKAIEAAIKAKAYAKAFLCNGGEEERSIQVKETWSKDFKKRYEGAIETKYYVLEEHIITLEHHIFDLTVKGKVGIDFTLNVTIKCCSCDPANAIGAIKKVTVKSAEGWTDFSFRFDNFDKTRPKWGKSIKSPKAKTGPVNISKVLVDRSDEEICDENGYRR